MITNFFPNDDCAIVYCIIHIFAGYEIDYLLLLLLLLLSPLFQFKTACSDKVKKCRTLCNFDLMRTIDHLER